MKNFKAICLILLVALVVSCNKEKEDSTVIGDVIVISKKVGNNTVYSYAYYAYAYNDLKSVEVKGAVNTTVVELRSSGPLSKNYFFKEPTDTEFSLTKPTSDTFIFTSTFESGSTFVDQDIVTSDILEPVTIEKCVYNAEKSYAEFGWTALANADAYGISIYDETESPVYVSSAFTTSSTSVTLKSGLGWKTGHPVAGKTYTVRFYAYKYENSNSPNLYHIQSTSLSEKALVWGQ